ncbi:MAG: AAC(3) family N-acetyltransferase [Halobacteriota archaeon]|uniref:AAC(3) family N-acetyltransferase n=1 Tax=Natronomonas sp. TaxID=2184060 RepID=UPI003976FFDB
MGSESIARGIRAPATQASRGANLIKHQLLKRTHERRRVGRASQSRFDRILDRHAADEDAVFVHVGLSDIASAFDTDPYAFLRSKVDSRFESVLAPGFTDYFKTSGVYHKTYSRPKHGTFGTLFLDDADYRTDDAIKSILVRGPYRFDDCRHDDSYHPDGCFARLVDDDVLVMNVGVPWITCSHLHYFESRHDAPYVVDETFEGVLYETETEHRRVTQTCGQYTSPFYSWNKPKIHRRLAAAGAIDAYDLNGLRLFFFSLGDVARVIGSELAEDPNYLVTL